MAEKSGMLLGRRDWDEAAQTWLDFVRKGEDYHRDELNNPATFELIGNTKGQTLLDMTCGEGWIQHQNLSETRCRSGRD
jgi:hypothetical protein